MVVYAAVVTIPCLFIDAANNDEISVAITGTVSIIVPIAEKFSPSTENIPVNSSFATPIFLAYA